MKRSSPSKTEVEGLKDDKIKLDKDLSDLKMENEQLTLATGDEALKSLKTEVEGLKKDKIKLDKDLSDLKMKNEHLTLATGDEALKSLRTEVEDLKKDKIKLEKDFTLQMIGFIYKPLRIKRSSFSRLKLKA